MGCRAQCQLACQGSYFPAISKLTFASSLPFTVTFWLVLPNFSCHTSTLYVPGGTSVNLKFPELSVTATYGVSVPTTHPCIQPWTSHFTSMTSGLSIFTSKVFLNFG